jgi:CheY-like chemotaxis protein
MLPPFLLLDDSYTDVQAMTALFKRIGLANPVRIIGTMEEAQRHLTECAPGRLPVIVFVASQVRGERGLDLLDWIRRQPDALGRLAAIALLDADDEDAAARAADLEVTVVSKPVEMRPLIDAMRRLGLPEKAKIDRMTLTVQVELWPHGSE